MAGFRSSLPLCEDARCPSLARCDGSPPPGINRSMMTLRPLAILLSLGCALSVLAEALISTAGVDALRVADVIETQDGEAVTFFLSTSGIYRSDSGAQSWTRQGSVQSYVDIAWGGGYTYAVDTDLRVRADNDGWPVDGEALPVGIVRGTHLAADDTNLLMIGEDSVGVTGLYQRAHETTTWVTVGDGLPADELIDVMTTSASVVLVATDTMGIWISTDGGASFTDTAQPDIRVVDWATDETGSLVLATDGADVLRNTTGGMGAWSTAPLGGPVVLSVGIGSDATLYAGTEGDGLYSSTSWPTFNSGAADGQLAALLASAPMPITAIGRDEDGDLVVGTRGRGVLTESNSGTLDFPNIPAYGGEVTSVVTGRTLGEAFLGTSGGGVFGSGDGGATWIGVSSSLDSREVYTLLLGDTFLYAGTDDGVHRADPTLLLWLRTGDDDLGGTVVYKLLQVGTRMLAATSAGIYTSDDNGNNWTQADAAVVEYLAYDGANLWAAAPGVFLTSTDDGDSWSAAGTAGVVGTPQRVFVAAGDVWLAVNDGLYRSADQATSWTEIDPGITPITAEADYVLVFSDIDDVLYVSEATGGFRVSFDDGGRWRDLFYGFPATSGGGLAPIRSYAEVIPPEPAEGEERDTGALLMGVGNVGLFGSTVAGPGDFNAAIHPGGGTVSVRLDDGNLTTFQISGDNPDRLTAPDDVLFSLGFYTYKVEAIEVGQAVTITLTFPTGASPDTYWMYGPTSDDAEDHWYEFLYDGTTGAEFDANVVTLHFVDGERGDADGVANAIIDDPSAPGYAVEPRSSGGGGAPGPILLGLLLVGILRRGLRRV